MYQFIIGEISEERQKNWENGEQNPYAVCKGEYLVVERCYVNSWCDADRFLRDHVDIDWGSIAWKGNREELIKLFTNCRWDTKRLDALKTDKDYAVVFIESAGEF